MKKSIKKISSLALAMLMAGSIMPMAFAADTDTEINQDTVQKQSDVKVSYEIKDSYKVTFPSEITIPSDFDATKEQTFTITASDIAIASNKDLLVSVEGDTRDLLYIYNEANQDESIQFKMGKAGTDYTGETDEATEARFSSNIGGTPGTLEMGLKLFDDTQLNGKSSGKYSSSDMQVNVSIVDKA